MLPTITSSTSTSSSTSSSSTSSTSYKQLKSSLYKQLTGNEYNIKPSTAKRVIRLFSYALKQSDLKDWEVLRWRTAGVIDNDGNVIFDLELQGRFDIELTMKALAWEGYVKTNQRIDLKTNY
jgi:hypothetical protein